MKLLLVGRMYLNNQAKMEEKLKLRIHGELHVANIEKKSLEALISREINYSSERYYKGRLDAKLEQIECLEKLLKDE